MEGSGVNPTVFWHAGSVFQAPNKFGSQHLVPTLKYYTTQGGCIFSSNDSLM